MIKTAIIGASGYIGRHLLASYHRAFPDCVGTAYSRTGGGLARLDISNPEIAPLRLEDSGHKAVLIAAANPNIAYCESQPAAAYAINVAGTLELIRQIGRTSMSIIFLSSDYVFDGMKGNYADTDPTNPTTEYGRHKAKVEQEIASLSNNYLILRLSKIFGLEKNDRTLLDDIARSLAAREPILAAADQYFCPTEVTDLVNAIHEIQPREANRVMNVCSAEVWSRYKIACELARALNIDEAFVKKISLYDISSMKGRPLNTAMRPSSRTDGIGPNFTSVHDAIRQVAANWIGDVCIKQKAA